jgi:4-diphosphocytidyl-2-C-methyl-D-erythritol kinase
LQPTLLVAAPRPQHAPASTLPRSHDEFAHAKINLFLHVTGRRPDGYHLLDSLVIFAGAADILHATPADDLALSITGPFGTALSPEPDNLVLRAARILGTSHGAHLTLEKNLPVASGIGGGSADAAATLRLLPRLWGTPPASPSQALSLGADVPVCLAATACRMSGIGETLSPAPILPPFGIALLNPGVAVATAAIFRARKGAFSRPAALPDAWPTVSGMATDLARLANELEAPALDLCPSIADALSALRATAGCLLARMSGSGATCFALYDTPAQAEAAARDCARPGWWAWGGAPKPID